MGYGENYAGTYLQAAGQKFSQEMAQKQFAQQQAEFAQQQKEYEEIRKPVADLQMKLSQSNHDWEIEKTLHEAAMDYMKHGLAYDVAHRLVSSAFHLPDGSNARDYYRSTGQLPIDQGVQSVMAAAAEMQQGGGPQGSSQPPVGGQQGAASGAPTIGPGMFTPGPQEPPQPFAPGMFSPMPLQPFSEGANSLVSAPPQLGTAPPAPMMPVDPLAGAAQGLGMAPPADTLDARTAAAMSGVLPTVQANLDWMRVRPEIAGFNAETGRMRARTAEQESQARAARFTLSQEGMQKHREFMEGIAQKRADLADEMATWRKSVMFQKMGLDAERMSMSREKFAQWKKTAGPDGAKQAMAFANSAYAKYQKFSKDATIARNKEQEVTATIIRMEDLLANPPQPPGDYATDAQKKNYMEDMEDFRQAPRLLNQLKAHRSELNETIRDTQSMAKKMFDLAATAGGLKEQGAKDGAAPPKLAGPRALPKAAGKAETYEQKAARLRAKGW